ncbi:MAG TPA: hypothetical protein VM888_06045, partial [Chitinophagaceae bacterium]|nr:hypothetical protein [Chitinophagaceae bacterium]
DVATKPYSYAYFISTDINKPPEQVEAGKPMIWNRDNKALKVFEIKASVTGGGNFNVRSFNMAEAKGGKTYWWWIDNAIVNKKKQ